MGLFLGTLPVSLKPWGLVRPLGELRLPSVPFDPFPEAPIIICRAVGEIAVLLAASSLLSVLRILTSPFAQFLGHISFSHYLIHMPVLLTVVSYDALVLTNRDVPYPWTAGISICLFFAVSLTGATGFYYAFEKPSITLSGRVGPFADGLARAFVRTLPAYSFQAGAALLERPLRARGRLGPQDGRRGSHAASERSPGGANAKHPVCRAQKRAPPAPPLRAFAGGQKESRIRERTAYPRLNSRARRDHAASGTRPTRTRRAVAPPSGTPWFTTVASVTKMLSSGWTMCPMPVMVALSMLSNEIA